MQRRKYTGEFKRETVDLANQSGISLQQLGSELGINANMIGRWRRELHEEGSSVFRGKGPCA